MSLVWTRSVQSERQELNGSRERLDMVVADAKRLVETYRDADDTSKISADLELITSHWQQMMDRSVSQQQSLASSYSGAPFTRYNLLSNRLSNRCDNRLYCVYKPVVQPGFTTGRTNSGCSFNTVERTVAVHSTRLSNWFDNRLYRVYKHSTGCQTRLTTSLTTGCIVYTASCQTDCTTRFDNWLNE